jgi:hypothetical protein
MQLNWSASLQTIDNCWVNCGIARNWSSSCSGVHKKEADDIGGALANA